LGTGLTREKKKNQQKIQERPQKKDNWRGKGNDDNGKIHTRAEHFRSREKGPFTEGTLVIRTSRGREGDNPVKGV